MANDGNNLHDRLGRDFDALEEELLYNRSLGPKQRYFETIARGIRLKYKKTPLEVLMEIATDENAGKSQRVIAASAALPYVHQKLPTAIDLSVDTPEHDATMDARAKLRDGLLRLGMDTPELDPVREVVQQAQQILAGVMMERDDLPPHEGDDSDG